MYLAALFVCLHNYSKSNECIFMKFFVWVWTGQRKGLNFGKDPDDTQQSHFQGFMVLLSEYEEPNKKRQHLGGITVHAGLP